MCLKWLKFLKHEAAKLAYNRVFKTYFQINWIPANNAETETLCKNCLHHKIDIWILKIENPFWYLKAAKMIKRKFRETNFIYKLWIELSFTKIEKVKQKKKM